MMAESVKTIGIVGGGQLGAMLAEAAHSLGFRTVVLDPSEKCPAHVVADECITGDVKDAAMIKELSQRADVLTFEIELANAGALKELLQNGVSIYPNPAILELIKNKFQQKQFLSKNNIPIGDFVPVETIEDAYSAGEAFGYPYVLKSRFDAYDGRGNRTVSSKEDIPAAFEQLSKSGLLYAEKFVPFVKELAVIGVRDLAGNMKVYPVVETVHKNHICHTVIAPAPVDEGVAEKAKEIGMHVLESLGGVGTFAVELFLTEDGTMLVNEIAPRVHNSGHFSIEGSKTSQFENHIRAITGMPLGDTAMAYPVAVMVNILGDRSGPAEPQGVEKALALGNTAVHLYGKLETRPERKMGHLTVVGKTLEETLKTALQARDCITI